MLNLQHLCVYDAVTAVQPTAAYLLQTFYMQNSVCDMDAVFYVYVWGTQDKGSPIAMVQCKGLLNKG